MATLNQHRSASERDASADNNSESLLQEFFINELKDIYWAEKHLTEALPKLADASTTQELKSAFQDHLKVTEGHVTRLEKAFELMGEEAEAKKCDAIKGITKEGEEIISDTDEGTVTRDAALIMAGQKAEHYEIATYGGLIQIAKTLKKEDVANLLEQTLNEEKEADKALTDLAEQRINLNARYEKKK